MEYITPERFRHITSNLRSRFDVEMFKARQNIGLELKRFFKASFSNQGFGGKSWQPRITGGSHPIFKRTSGRMEQNIRLLNSTQDLISVGISGTSDTPFAVYHNDPTGGSGISNNTDTGRFTENDNKTTWKRNQYTNKPITRRQFIGFDESLERFTIKQIEQALKNTFE